MGELAQLVNQQDSKTYTIYAGQTLCISTVKNTASTGGGTGGTNQGPTAAFQPSLITGVSCNTR
jgi:hypothetical protein